MKLHSVLATIVFAGDVSGDSEQNEFGQPEQMKYIIGPNND